MTGPRHARRVLTVPGWWSTVAEAEDATTRLVVRDDIVSACTHALDGIAVATVELMPGVEAPWGSVSSPPGAIGHLAELAHENRWSGRAFVFRGQSALAGCVTVADLVERTAVDAVVLPGEDSACAGTVGLRDADGARPVFRDGRLVLMVRPAGPGVVVPFERRATPVTPAGGLDGGRGGHGGRGGLGGRTGLHPGGPGPRRRGR